MIHPNTKLQFINDEIGYGVFATAFIPKGTITYVKDALEPEITPEQFLSHTPAMQKIIEKYSYIDQHGVRIVSWDFGRFVNHCCNCNTISTGYGFEIALRDIKPGEEITDEYGLFNMEDSFELDCKYPGCRMRVNKFDVDLHYQKWDAQILEVLGLAFELEQPLWNFMDRDTKSAIQLFHDNPDSYVSVRTLKYTPTQTPVQSFASSNGLSRS
jgi:hypothetical protein